MPRACRRSHIARTPFGFAGAKPHLAPALAGRLPAFAIRVRRSCCCSRVGAAAAAASSPTRFYKKKQKFLRVRPQCRY